MRTFDASLPAGGFWAAVTVPPLAFLTLVQVWANGIAAGEISVQSTLLLVALSEAMPLGALAWTVLSAAAYSIGPGKLVVHRVMFDREFPFENLVEPPRLQNGVITLRVPRRLRGP